VCVCVISAFFVMHCVSLVVAFVLRLCLYDVLCFWSLSLPWEREREREKSEMWNEDKTRLPLGSPYNYYNNPSCRPWMTREHRCFSPSCLGSLSLLCPPPNSFLVYCFHNLPSNVILACMLPSQLRPRGLLVCVVPSLGSEWRTEAPGMWCEDLKFEKIFFVVAVVASLSLCLVYSLVVS